MESKIGRNVSFQRYHVVACTLNTHTHTHTHIVCGLCGTCSLYIYAVYSTLCKSQLSSPFAIPPGMTIGCLCNNSHQSSPPSGSAELIFPIFDVATVRCHRYSQPSLPLWHTLYQLTPVISDCGATCRHNKNVICRR